MLLSNVGPVPGYVLFLVLAAVAVAIFAYRARYLYRLLALGQPEKRSGGMGARLWSVVGRIPAQVCSLREVSIKDRAGVGHFFIFWGFISFSLSYALLVGQGFREDFFSLVLTDAGAQVFGFILDTLAVIVMAAILVAVYRRFVVKPDRLSQSGDAVIILSVIFSLMLLSVVTEGFHLAATGEESRAWLSSALAGAVGGLGQGALESLYRVFWWLHFVVVFGFLAYIPFSKHLHIMLAPFNIFLRTLKPKGALDLVDLEKAETFGVARIQGFSWKHLMDLYTCTECGRCSENCPAHISGKALSPKELILDMKHHLLEEGPGLLKGKTETGRSLIGDVITEEVIWDCTTCRACQERCPVFIEHIDKIIDMRRNLVLEQARFADTAQGALKSLEARGHPWRGTRFSRTDWTEGLGVKTLAEAGNTPLLYFVGCTAALEDRNMKVAKAFAKVLQAAGVEFAILGTEETCCGDPARRLGNEYLYQILAKQNIETFQRYGVKQVVTACPHCFNTIKNEYPQLGGTFQVFHHSQFLAELLVQGKLKASPQVAGKLTLHDSCYLGRHNGILDAPREVLKAVADGNLVEMPRHGLRGLCCGGGGGHMWLEETTGRRINQMRSEEALNTGAGQVATACPFCLSMFDDGLKALGKDESMKAQDLAELLAAALPAPTA